MNKMKGEKYQVSTTPKKIVKQVKRSLNNIFRSPSTSNDNKSANNNNVVGSNNINNNSRRRNFVEISNQLERSPSTETDSSFSSPSIVSSSSSDILSEEERGEYVSSSHDYLLSQQGNVSNCSKNENGEAIGYTIKVVTDGLSSVSHHREQGEQQDLLSYYIDEDFDDANEEFTTAASMESYEEDYINDDDYEGDCGDLGSLECMISSDCFDEYCCYVEEEKIQRLNMLHTRRQLIQDELEKIVDQTEKEELKSQNNDDCDEGVGENRRRQLLFEPEAIEALQVAATKLAYCKRYYDEIMCQYVYVPSVAYTIMDGSLLEEASKIYADATCKSNNGHTLDGDSHDGNEFLIRYAAHLGSTVISQGKTFLSLRQEEEIILHASDLEDLSSLSLQNVEEKDEGDFVRQAATSYSGYGTERFSTEFVRGIDCGQPSQQMKMLWDAPSAETNSDKSIDVEDDLSDERNQSSMSNNNRKSNKKRRKCVAIIITLFGILSCTAFWFILHPYNGIRNNMSFASENHRNYMNIKRYYHPDTLIVKKQQGRKKSLKKKLMRGGSNNKKPEQFSSKKSESDRRHIKTTIDKTLDPTVLTDTGSSQEEAAAAGLAPVITTTRVEINVLDNPRSINTDDPSSKAISVNRDNKKKKKNQRRSKIDKPIVANLLY